MEFSYKIYNESEELLLAIADSAILGKTFEEGEIQLTVSEFYDGNKCDKNKALTLIKDATIINAVGKDIIDLLKQEDIIDKNFILKINGIPHAQVILVK